MRMLLALFAAIACIAAAAPQQNVTPAVIPLNPDAGAEDTEGIVVPTGSPVQLASFSRDEINAKFNGRFELSGTYEIEGYGEDASVTIWPDQKSKDRLPRWNVRGGPEKLFVTNGWQFAQAVASKAELAQLESGRQPLIRGQITIVADEYETGIECDSSYFMARFVSVVKNVEMAGDPPEQYGC